MANTLNFISTVTVEKFKQLQGAERLEVLENPHTGKIFFACGGLKGAVSKKGIPPKSKAMVSQVCGEDGVEFFLLHEEGTGPAPVKATF